MQGGGCGRVNIRVYSTHADLHLMNDIFFVIFQRFLGESQDGSSLPMRLLTCFQASVGSARQSGCSNTNRWGNVASATIGSRLKT